MSNKRNARQLILAIARMKDPTLGEDAMIASMEWGYWIGGLYVSKEEVIKAALANKETP